MAALKEYQKLPGKGRPPFPASLAGGNFRLYLSQDHLLKVEASYWSETYRRYYLKDIQLLQITQTKSENVVTTILLVLIIFFAALGWFVEAAALFFYITAGVFTVFLAIHLTLGPRCRVKITTPLGTDDLHSLSRLRVAKKVFDRIVPLIRAAQETADPAELVERLAVETPAARMTYEIPKLQISPLPKETLKGEKWVALLFAFLLLMHAGCGIFSLLQPAGWLPPVGLGVLAAAFGLSVFLLIRPAPGCPRKLATSFIVYLGLYGVLLYVVLIQAAILDPEKLASQSDFYPILLEQMTKQNSFNIFLHAFTAAVSGTFGLLTAGLVFTHRSQDEEIPPPPPTPGVPS